MVALGCSGDDGGVPAADASPDAPSGPLEFETQVTDLAARTPLFDVRVAEDGADNETASAPNGRAVLELSGDTAVIHELDGYLSNRMEVSAAALALHAAARQPQLSELVTATDLDDLYTGLGLVRDAAATQVLVYVRGSDFSAATGVTVSAGLQTAIRRASGDFELGDTAVDDPLVIVANAPGSTLSITVPETCVGATEIELVAGQLASTFLVCD